MAGDDLEQRMLNNALSFVEGAARCENVVTNKDGTSGAPLGVAVVCYAFASELFFKLLLQIKTATYPNSHNLGGLFEQLPPDCKASVISVYELISKMAVPNLISGLQPISSAFEEWRYIHEQLGASVNMQLLRHLIHALYATARELRPTLTVSAAMQERMKSL